MVYITPGNCRLLILDRKYLFMLVILIQILFMLLFMPRIKEVNLFSNNVVHENIIMSVTMATAAGGQS